MHDLRVRADRAFFAADEQKKLAEKVVDNFMHRLKGDGWEMGIKGLKGSVRRRDVSNADRDHLDI